MTDTTKEAIQLLLDTGKAQQTVHENVMGDPFFITPAGEAKGLHGFFPPRRIEARVMLLDAGSFADYVNRFKSERTLIFAEVTETAATLKAVLDYHQPHQPEYCRHVAEFATIETPEWKIWKAANRKPMNQVEFATWLEDNLSLFVSGPRSDSPTATDLLELVRTLHGHQNARFNTALRLDNGAYSVAYDEDVEVKGTSATRGGQVELPKEISAGFAIFQGAEKYLVPARLKTRCSERKLAIWFETIALHAIVRESILALVKQVADKTGIVPMLGAPR
jgi:uncharacterized protein YfdQ (DUF2303 family)